MMTRAWKWIIGAILLVTGAAVGVAVLRNSAGKETMQRNLPETLPDGADKKAPRKSADNGIAVVTGEDRIGGDNLSEDQRQRIAALMKERDERLNAIWADRTLPDEEQQRKIRRLNEELEAKIQEVLQHK